MIYNIGNAYDTENRKAIEGTFIVHPARNSGCVRTITGRLLFKRGKFEIFELRTVEKWDTGSIYKRAEIVSFYDGYAIDSFWQDEADIDYVKAYNSFRGRVKARQTRLAKKLVALQEEFDDINAIFNDLT